MGGESSEGSSRKRLWLSVLVKPTPKGSISSASFVIVSATSFSIQNCYRKVPKQVNRKVPKQKLEHPSLTLLARYFQAIYF